MMIIIIYIRYLSSLYHAFPSLQWRCYFCDRREKIQWGINVSTIEPGEFKTNISNPEIFKAKFTKQWNNLDPAIRKEYGQEYFQSGRILFLNPVNIKIKSLEWDYLVILGISILIRIRKCGKQYFYLYLSKRIFL